MSRPFVSCVIPVYNGARFIEETIASVQSQTRPPDEIIVIDDGSTDKTADVVRAQSGVTYVRQDNAGVSSARNHGIARARGELLSFVDADDLWLPEKLERQLQRLDAAPNAELTVCEVELFWMSESQRADDVAADPKLAGPHVAWVFQAMLIRRSLFSRVGVLEPSLRFGEDTEWIIRARDHGVVIDTLHEMLVRRRIHDTNLHRVFRKETADLMAGFLRKSLARRKLLKSE